MRKSMENPSCDSQTALTALYAELSQNLPFMLWSQSWGQVLTLAKFLRYNNCMSFCGKMSFVLRRFMLKYSEVK